MRVFACLSVLLALPGMLGAQVGAGPTTAARLKAAFVYKFTLLVTWPEHAFDAPDEPLSICILGRDPFDGELESAVDGRESQGRELAVRRFQRPDQVRGCHVLYVAVREAGSVQQILTAVADTPTLTIGETSEFAARGGVIHLQQVAMRIAFEINRAAAQRAGLHISSKLLQVARAVHD